MVNKEENGKQVAIEFLTAGQENLFERIKEMETNGCALHANLRGTVEKIECRMVDLNNTIQQWIGEQVGRQKSNATILIWVAILSGLGTIMSIIKMFVR